MKEVIVGIDLGTTNSEIAVIENGKPRVIAVDGDPIVPSVVGLAEDGKLLVGKTARNQFVLAPERTVKSVKRKMGQEVVLPLGEQSFRPQEISAMILKRLKDAAEKDLGQPVKKAVITVPAYFNDTQRQATREAGQLAGLEVVRILNEPTAAALVYNPNPESAECFLVYDLGGGTFDVSIVRAEGGVYEVLASHGDTALGGDDFDDLLVDDLAQEFQLLYGVDLRADRVSRARLLRAAEAAKRHLSDHPFARIEEEFIAEKDGVPLHLSVEVTREKLESLIAPLIQKTMDCLKRALDDAKLSPGNIQRVVLVGGSTRTPMISRMLEERLNQQAHKEVHPDLCVAMGAAIQAGIIGGEKVGAVLVDITPHTLGVKCVEYPSSYSMHLNQFKFAPILPRNTPLPAVRSEAFATVTDQQPVVDIELYQGESTDIRRNHHVGKFSVSGLAPVPAGNLIVVELKLSVDGTLSVTAREKATGLKKEITIENAIAKFALEEKSAAQERLNRLWSTTDESEAEMRDLLDEELESEDPDFNPYAGIELGHDDEPEPSEAPPSRNRRFADTEADDQPDLSDTLALLEKAARIRARASAEDQTELDTHIEKVRMALDQRDWAKLKIASDALSEILFYLEDA